MRTLGRMVQELHDEIMFNPDLKTYTDSFVRRLQNKYNSLAESAPPYEFFIRTTTLPLYAQINPAATISLGSTTLNLRRLETTDPTWLNASWAGQGTWIHEDGTEYEIVQVDTANGYIYLDAPVSVALAGTERTAWTIKFWKYLLPSDTIQVLGYRDDRETDGWGKIPSVGRLTEEMETLKRSTTGRPQWAIEDDSKQRRPPFEAPTLAANTSGALSLRTYEYRYTIMGAGLESAPSPEAQITLTGSQDQVDLSGFEEIRHNPGTGLVETGLRIRVYRRDITKRGRWMAIRTITGTQAAAGISDTTMLPTYAATYDDVVYDNPEGTRQTVRLYYTADEDRTISLRLWFRPRPFQSKADAPLGPSAVSDYLVNSVLADILKGDDRRAYYARAMEALDNLKASMTKIDERYRMSSWKEDQLESRWVSPRDRNLGTPSIS
ncbi:MAG TPA: hypothetical protein VI911_04345 [Patescibacteria group bacterium]|nr:hypothetical protein [Patescibacteria group bacterium]